MRPDSSVGGEQRTENPRVAGSIPALGIRGTGEDGSEGIMELRSIIAVCNGDNC